VRLTLAMRTALMVVAAMSRPMNCLVPTGHMASPIRLRRKIPAGRGVGAAPALRRPGDRRRGWLLAYFSNCRPPQTSPGWLPSTWLPR
jgi:hypothetical protein